METLSGKVALITGGGRGLGAAIGQALAEAGATAILADVRVDLAEQTAKELQTQGLEAIALSLDITNDQQIETAIQKIIDQYGHLDVLINNAGTDVTLSVEELSIADWDRVLNVNLRAPFYHREGIVSLLEQANLLKLNEDELQVIMEWRGVEAADMQMQLQRCRTRRLSLILSHVWIG